MDNRRKMFVKHYLVDFNATKAAIAAGYSKKGATVTGCRLLANDKIKAEIEKSIAKACEKLEITTEKVLAELAKIGFSNMYDYIKVYGSDPSIDFSSLTREQAAAIQEVTIEEYTEGRGEEKRDIKRTRFKLADKRGSLELLGKYLKLFTDKVEVTSESMDLGELPITDTELRTADKPN
jgi:phage terminase small subunit